MTHEFCVETVSGDSHAGACQHPLLGVSPCTRLRTDADQSEIRRAASKISNQQQFVFAQIRLVRISRRDRFEFEVHLGNAGHGQGFR